MMEIYTKNKGNSKMNLIICHTPLQVIIAERIIDLHPNEQFYGILFTSNMNSKFDYYFKRLSKRCLVFDYFIYSQGLFKNFDTFFNLYKLKNKLSKYNFNKIILASIDNLLCQTLLSNDNFDRLETFDDGTANIYKKSIFFMNEKYTFIQLIARWLLGVSYNLQKIKSNSSLHYTIYDMENIIDNLQSLSLYSFIENNSEKSELKKIRIFLGQPINELGITIDILNGILEKYQINYYFPHPREINKEINIEYIDTHLIFEDYIYQQVKENPSYIYEIYSICSTASLNVLKYPNVKVKIIKSDLTQRALDDIYDLFSKVGVDILT